MSMLFVVNVPSEEEENKIIRYRATATLQKPSKQRVSLQRYVLIYDRELTACKWYITLALMTGLQEVIV